MPFFNIFSKKKEKKEKAKPEIKILVDNHEKNSLVPSYLLGKGMKIEFTHMEIADYLINNIAIERKTFNDFASSIINKRIFQQLENLKKYKKCLMLIEGFDFNYESFMHENALRGAILSVLLSFQIPIIFTKNEEDSAKFLAILANKKEKEQSLRQSRDFKNLKEQKQFILEGFPGIGPVTAKKLLGKNKSLKEIFNLTEEQLKEQKIRSLNENKIKKFRKILED